MSITADKQRKSIREMLSLRRAARDTAHADCLRAIQDNVVVTSPKVYESGLITSLDLRLVDLYGDCEAETSAENVSAPGNESSSEIAWW